MTLASSSGRKFCSHRFDRPVPPFSAEPADLDETDDATAIIEAQCESIREAWRKIGEYGVVVSYERTGADCYGPIFTIRTNLINGLPPRHVSLADHRKSA